ncbi:DUF2066 domain-containing protein [Marinobacter sp. SS21]|uniref:DUF2066 domain-containing protein n=1 Tax=Marinobacter sp. SS21 TaxID=2979460 RepID=UPI00232CA1D6|nr:DUF2066 domain-containing protein [Marinobacter sp. SS21]MDC0663915.1 DUF2066 domain-containing protein [Marinobacter sp. SS21]
MPTYRFILQTLPLLSLLLGYFAPAQAVSVDGLYSVEVPVAGSSPQQLQAGYVEGLRRVLLRVSGSREVLQREETGALLERAESLLQSYQYLRAEQNGASNRLRMTFGSVGVNQALSSINAPVWGANRPLTLAWVAVQTSSGRQLVTAPEASGALSPSERWYRAFQNAAASRGLPLVLPAHQAAGNRELLSEVWGQFMGRIRAESEAIGHDLLASVRINFDRNTWRASWVLEGRGLDESEASLSGSSPEQVAELIVGRWADMLAARYAVEAGEVGESPQVDIVLDEVDSLEDYAAIKAALLSMTPVQSAGPVSVKANQAILRVAFSGELRQLQEYMALDTRFVPVREVQTNVGSQESPPVPNIAATQSSLTSPADAVESTVENGVAVVADGNAPATNEEGDLFRYQPLAVEAADADKAFESLYPILHYRWQASPIRSPGERE